MIIKIILIFCLIIIVAYTINLTEKIIKDRNKISFKESMDLANFPIITFVNNNKKLNFLLDTGSTDSHINNSELEFLDFKLLDKNVEVFGIEGSITNYPICSMTINYKDKSYNEYFFISNLDEAFKKVKEKDGVNLHGILGNSFLEKNSCKIDFKKLAAYIN